jgi:galactokinase
LPARQIALLCQRAENEFVGVCCGILDQFTSCLGEAGCVLLLDCRDLSVHRWNVDPGIQIVICDTRSPRDLAASAYRERRSECESVARALGVASLRAAEPDALDRALPGLGVAGQRALFIAEENDRCLALAQALAGGDRDCLSRLCQASFDGARDLFGICSTPMEAMMAAMLAAPGAIGARQAGAGFGGCMVALVERDWVAEFAAAVHAGYLHRTGLRAEVFPVSLSKGAEVMLTGAAAQTG